MAKKKYKSFAMMSMVPSVVSKEVIDEFNRQVGKGKVGFQDSSGVPVRVTEKDVYGQ